MKVVKRLCQQDYTLTDQEGTSFTVQKGTVYTTTLTRSDDTVIVFSQYWVKVPVSIFDVPDRSSVNCEVR